MPATTAEGLLEAKSKVSRWPSVKASRPAYCCCSDKVNFSSTFQSHLRFSLAQCKHETKAAGKCIFQIVQPARFKKNTEGGKMI